MTPDLELVSTDDLVDELKKRFDVLLVVGDQFRTREDIHRSAWLLGVVEGIKSMAADVLRECEARA